MLWRYLHKYKYKYKIHKTKVVLHFEQCSLLWQILAQYGFNHNLENQSPSRQLSWDPYLIQRVAFWSCQVFMKYSSTNSKASFLICNSKTISNFFSQGLLHDRHLPSRRVGGHGGELEGGGGGQDQQVQDHQGGGWQQGHHINCGPTSEQNCVAFRKAEGNLSKRSLWKYNSYHPFRRTDPSLHFLEEKVLR